jgi:hypothetical protein
MLKWLLVVCVVLAVLAVLMPHARGRYRIGRLPGDLEFPARGRIYYIPLASTVVLSLLVWLVGRLI